MKTTKALLVRKPSNFEEVLKFTKKYIEEAEKVIVEKTVKLTDVVYQKLIDNPMTETFDFLKNQGRIKDGKMLTVEIKCKIDLASQRRRIWLREVHGNTPEVRLIKKIKHQHP